jgi:hypothetical protein
MTATLDSAPIPAVGFFIPKDYTWVILVALLLGVLYQLMVIPVDKARAKYFSPEFLSEHFKEEHEAAFPGEPMPKWGYPDTGSGRYAEKLTYEQWFNFNVAHRIHFNFFEQIQNILLVMLVAGLAYPILTACLGAIHLMGRIVYFIFYQKKGPKGRLYGFFFMATSGLAM